MIKQFFKKKSSALTLSETICVLIIILMCMPIFANMIERSLIATQQEVAANHINTVNKAVGEYIKAHFVSLLETTNKTEGLTLTVSDLVAEDLLPEGFNPINVWRQAYLIYIRQPINDELQGITLTTGGFNGDKKFNGVTIPGTAILVGGAGGYIPTGVIPGQTNSMLIGSHYGWKINLTNFNIPSPGKGHIGTLSSFDVSELKQDFLYRIKVPGQLDLNAMQTELDMTDHSIEKVRDIQFVSHTIDEFVCAETDNQGKMFFDEDEGVYLCRENKAVILADTGNSALLSNIVLASHDDVIDKPICPRGTDTIPYIHTMASIVATGQEATPLAAIQAYAVSLNDTQWQVKLRLLSKGDDWINPSANYGKIVVLSTCMGTL